MLGITGIGRAEVVVVAVLGRARLAGSTLADVIFGTGIVVIAGSGIICKYATLLWVAAVVGAAVAVVAGHGLARHAGAAAAGVAYGAGTAVIANQRIVADHTTLLGITGIGGAQDVVFAVLGGADLASSSDADIALGASVVVAAHRRIVCKYAALLWVAAVIGAAIAVIAGHDLAGQAGPAAADVAQGANAAVIARRRVVSRLATPFCVTGFGRAGVAVIAARRLLRRAGTVLAGVPRGAVVVVTANGGIVCKYAAFAWVAAVVGARISVVAGQAAGGRADAAFARIAQGTDIAIGARQLIVCENAAVLGVAAVCGARIAVVANRRRTWQTHTGFAGIADSANAVVAARGRVVIGADAALGWVATINRASVFVVANDRRALAVAVAAGVSGGASAAVVTKPCLAGVLALARDAVVIGASEAVVA